VQSANDLVIANNGSLAYHCHKIPRKPVELATTIQI